MQQSNNKEQDNIKLSNEILIPKIVSLLEEDKTVTLPLKGFSMRPFLESDRDKALLIKVADFNVGDPVLAEVAPHRYVLHRVTKIDGDVVTLLGDGNLTPEYCYKKDVRASVIGFYRKGKNKLDRIDGRKWKVYSKIWMTLRPIRRLLLAIYKRV